MRRDAMLERERETMASAKHKQVKAFLCSLVGSHVLLKELEFGKAISLFDVISLMPEFLVSCLSCLVVGWKLTMC